MYQFIREITPYFDPVRVFPAFKDDPYSFFLDSSQMSPRLGRWSFIGSMPFAVFSSKENSVSVAWRGGPVRKIRTANPFTELQSLMDRFRTRRPLSVDIPFLAGGVGYFSYDLKNFVEDLPDKAEDDLGLPDCIVGLYDCVIAFDQCKRRCFVALTDIPGVAGKSAHRSFREKICGWREGIGASSDGEESFADGAVLDRSSLRSNFTKAEYIKTIEKAKTYIKKGDIYQVNISQRFETSLGQVALWDLYRTLRSISPAPFASYLNFNTVTVLSSSPERFVKRVGDYIETRPIKGTRPRGVTGREDDLLAEELLASAKDRAEHVMIVDLERNDLGRICRYGSVYPKEFIALERYETVFHLVSTVSGKLRKGLSPSDCLLATFPGGSITGAPKVRAMEIIEELEPTKRSIYTGSIGYIGFDGAIDTSIVIRTCILKDTTLYFQVGGGIVADSDPDMEYRETLDKAKGILRALEASTNGAVSYAAL